MLSVDPSQLHPLIAGSAGIAGKVRPPPPLCTSPSRSPRLGSSHVASSCRRLNVPKLVRAHGGRYLFFETQDEEAVFTLMQSDDRASNHSCWSWAMYDPSTSLQCPSGEVCAWYDLDHMCKSSSSRASNRVSSSNGPCRIVGTWTRLQNRSLKSRRPNPSSSYLCPSSVSPLPRHCCSPSSPWPAHPAPFPRSGARSQTCCPP